MSNAGNTLGTATPLTLGSSLQVITDTLDTADLSHYYQFRLSRSSSFNLSLTGLNADANVQLLNSNGIVLQESSNPDALAELINESSLNAGLYYIRVFSEVSAVSSSYSLSVQAKTGTHHADLLWRHAPTGNNGIWFMDGTTIASVASLPSLGGSWEMAGTGDFDGDGQTDLVFRDAAAGNNSLWLLVSSTLSSIQIIGTVGDTSWEIGGAADFNQDGQADLLWRNRNSGANGIWLMSGATILSVVGLPTFGAPTWYIQGVGDMNGDGFSDIIWRDYQSGNNAVWLMHETTQTSAVSLQARVDLNWHVEGAGDFNNDGSPDLLWRHYQSGANELWLMNGTTYVSTVALPSVADLDWKTTAPLDRYEAPIPIDSAGNTTSTAFQVGTLTGTGTYHGLVSHSDPDYYQFVVTDPTTVSVSLSGLSGGTLTLSGDGINGTGTPSSTISEQVLSPGTYYIRVEHAAAASTAYQLNLMGLLTAELPEITVALANDTTWYGLTDEDGITSDPTVTGEITSLHGVSALQARFANSPAQSFVTIQSWLQSGSFTLDATILNSIYGGALPQGNNSLELRVTDNRGAVTTATLTIHLDTLAPAAPNNLTLTPVGSTAIRVGGSAEAGALVQLFDGGEDPIAEVFATAAGSWSVTTSQLRNGTHNLTAHAIDVAGNVSTLSTLFTTTITTLVPSAPQDLRLTAATDTGASNADGVTTDRTPQIAGSAEAGATVRVWREQQLLGETVADANGQWTFAIMTDLPEGTHAFRAIAHNANGDSAAATLSVTIDATTPIAQVKTLAAGSESQVVLADGAMLTAGTRLIGTVNGTGSAVVSLRYQLGTLPEVTVPVAENGLFIQSLDFGGLSGTQTLTVKSVDLAGNEMVQSYTVTLDTTGGGVSVAPLLLAQLTQDTGTADDGWTYVPGIAGIVSERSQVTGLWATFDPAPTATFQDVTALLNVDGTFSFDESLLAALTDDGLVDGTYTLRLQVQTATGQLIEQSIPFQLDRSAPAVSLPDVIDGIAWERGMHFLGTVQDNTNAVQMVYEIARASDGQSVAQHSFTVAGSLTGTAFDQVLDELTIGNPVLQEEEVYNLIVTSTDVAGNAQRTRFQFFVPGDRRVSDDDLWTSPTNPNDPPTDAPPNPNETPSAGNLYSWGYVGSGGGWGYYGGSGSGGGWTPGYDGQLTPEGKDDHRALTGNGYEYEYAESVDAIVRQAVDWISTSPDTIHQKAALNNRQNILSAIGDRLNTLIQADGNFTNDQALIDQMRPAMAGLFADAYDPMGSKAGVYGTFVPWGGAWLAQELVQDGHSVREQVFQATLLEMVTETFATRQIAMSQSQQSALTAAVLELAKTYAWFNPTPEAAVPSEDEAFGFLDRLWRLQVPTNGQFQSSGEIATALGQAVTQLGQLLEGVNDPVRAIQFINNLIQAASNVPVLKNDLKDAQFLRELIEFGVEFVKSNPTVNQTATDTAVQGFLDRLWRGDAQQVKQAQGGLSAFLAGMDTEAEKIKGLDFAVNLLDAAELLQGEGLENQKYDPVFLDALLSLGGAYAGIDPGSNGELKFALDDIWQGSSSNFVTSFEEFLEPVENSSINQVLEFSSKLLKAIESVPAAQPFIKDPTFLKQYIYLARDYIRLNPDGYTSNAFESHLNLLYAAKSPQGIAVAAARLQQEADRLAESMLVSLAGGDELSPQPFVTTDDDSRNLKNILTSGISRYSIPEYSVYNIVAYEQNPSEEFVIVNANDGSDYGKLAYNQVYSIGSNLGYTDASGYTNSHFYLLRDGELYYYLEGTPLILEPGDKLLVENRFSPQPDRRIQLTDADKAQVKAGLEELAEFYQPLGRFVAGAIYQWAYDAGESGRTILNTLIPEWSKLDQSVEEDLPKDPAFVAGRLLGDGAAAVAGLIAFIAGGAAVGGGTTLCITGIGCLGGAPAVVAGSALAVTGAVTLKEALENALQNASVLLSSGLSSFFGKDSSNAGSGSPTPPNEAKVKRFVRNNPGLRHDEGYAIQDVLRRASTNSKESAVRVFREDNIRSFLGVKKDPVTNKVPDMPEAIIEKRNGTFVAIEVKNRTDPRIEEVIEKFEEVTNLMKEKKGKIVSEHVLYLNKDKFEGFRGIWSIGKGNIVYYENKPYQLSSGQHIHIKFTDFVGLTE